MTSNDNLVQGLKELQSMAMKMYAQSHGYHWNIEGREFKQDHAFLLEIYDDVFDSIDTYAESIRKIGAKSPFGLIQLQQNSALKINDSLDLTSIQMFNELSKTNLQIIDKLKDAFDVATELRENGIANFLADRQDKHAFWQWQLTETLK
jgi:starvation-inducible DNA-binding protein